MGGTQQSKVINMTGDTVHILVFKDSDHHWFQDIRQPPSDGRPIELSLDGSNDGRPVKVGVIHNEIGGRYVFDLFRLATGATLIVKKVTKNSGVQDYERSNGIELLSLGRTISTLACRPDWLLRGQSKSSGPPPATAEVSTVGSSNQQQADQQSGHPPRTDD